MASRPNKNKRKSKHQETGELRIIGGQWKRTKLSFPVLEGVRPTPSRVRETLFNWLAADIQGSVCVDLFAGSGALGFEALSRGADKVVFVDQAGAICRCISEHIDRLTANAEVLQGNAMDVEHLVAQLDCSPDIIFCDPPFNQGTIPDLLANLSSSEWLSSPTYVYIETEAALSDLDSPTSWQLLREKKAGDVLYRLYLSS